MGGGDLATESGLALGDDRVAEADHEDAEFEQASAHRDRLRGVVHDDRADRGRALQHLEADASDAFAGGGGVGAELRDPLGLAHEDLDRLVGAARDRRGQRVREERRAAPLDHEFDHRPRAGHVAAGATPEGLAERAREEVDPRAVHAPVLVRATTGRAHDAGAVAVVDHELRVELVADRAECRQIADVALHAEDAVGDDPDLAGHVGVRLGGDKLLAQVVEIAVLVDTLVDALLDHRREPDAVDDRSVVELVGDDEIARLAERREDRFVRIPAAREGVRRLDTVELGDAILKTLVAVEGAADESHARGARAVATQSFEPGLDDFRMVGQAEIVVRAETDHLAMTTKLHGGTHGPLDRLQPLQLAGLREMRERGGGAIGEDIVGVEGGHVARVHSWRRGSRLVRGCGNVSGRTAPGCGARGIR